MEVQQIKEYKDGSAAFSFDMSPQEENDMMLAGLKQLVKEIDFMSPVKNHVLESIDLNGDYNVFSLTKEQEQILITEGIYQALKHITQDIDI